MRIRRPRAGEPQRAARDRQAARVAHQPGVDRLPPLGGTASARLTHGRYIFESTARYAAAQHRLSERDRTDPRIDPAGTPAWVTFHLGAGAVIGRFTVSLRLDNLLDRHYREHGSGTESPGFNAGILLRYASPGGRP